MTGSRSERMKLAFSMPHLIRLKARPGQTLQEIVDRLGWFKDLGVTFSSVPTPPVRDLAAAEDYMQWVIEEVRPKVA